MCVAGLTALVLFGQDERLARIRQRSWRERDQNLFPGDDRSSTIGLG